MTESILKHEVVIFSAGVHNVIEEKLIQEQYPMDRIHIVSNEICYDTRKVKNPQLINACNKNSKMLPLEVFKSDINWFVLIGDSAGDHQMMDEESIEAHQDIFRIGLVNVEDVADRERTESMIKRYCNLFDAIVINDTDFKFLTDLVRSFMDMHK